MNTLDKITGCILGAAVGDAMGAATETRTIDMIKNDFGGYVRTIIAPPDDCFARHRPAGTVTDDFSLAYHTCLQLIKSKGHVTETTAKECLTAWSEDRDYCSVFAGPTTQKAILALKGIPFEDSENWLACNNHRATNGAAMKIFPAGLINPGDFEKTIRDTITLCLPTHTADAALSGACAISCAVSAAMLPDATLDSVLEAGLYGAKHGLAEGKRRGTPCAYPSVEKRISLAIDIGNRSATWEKAMYELTDIIGTGISIAESVPCVFGILAATRSDPMLSIITGVNIGNDTDTIATMAGAVAGALYGNSTIPIEYMDLINSVNHYDLMKLAIEVYHSFYSSGTLSSSVK